MSSQVCRKKINGTKGCVKEFAFYRSLDFIDFLYWGLGISCSFGGLNGVETFVQ